jgi:virginiamycin B lyase
MILVMKYSSSLLGFAGRRSRVLLTAALLTIGAALAAQTAAADPVAQITEFSSGLNAGSGPEGIAPGPDGNLWFTDQGTTSAIGRITPQGQITEFSSGLNVGSMPYRISPGPDGNLWFTDRGTTSAIGRITPQGQITEFSAGLSTGSDLLRIVPGPDGNMWFTNVGTTRAVGRITLQGQITEFTTGLNSGSRPDVIAPGSDGNLWFTDDGTTSAIGRITPQGQITEFSSGLNSGSSPSGLAPGPDGNLWFTDVGATEAIGRITPQAQITEYSTGLNAGHALTSGIAAGADGNLWFGDRGSTPAIGRITPQGQIAEFSSGLNVGSSPGRIVPGSDGNMWFTDRGTTPAIGKIGTAATAAVQAAPTVAGSGRAESALTCQGAQFAGWLGITPSLVLYPFDGYRWLLDGVPITGQTGQGYTPAVGNVGHQLSCQATASYPLPLFVTTPAAVSAAITVGPALPRVSALRVSPASFRLTGRRAAGSCQPLTRANRNHRPCRRRLVLRALYMLTSAGTVTFTVEQRTSGRLVHGRCVRVTHANRRRRHCSLITLGSFSRTGTAGSDALLLPARIGGHRLGPGAYLLLATPSVGGQKGSSQTVAFRILP